jgi:Replication-relaxation
MLKTRGLSLSPGTLTGLFFIHRYRFLTIHQFARIAGFSAYHSGEVLRRLETRSAVGYFGFVSIPGHGKTPKVYFLKRRGYEFLRSEGGYEEEELGTFVEAHQEITWSPQMYHRLRLLDLFIALEAQVRDLPHLSIVRTFLEYRRVKWTHQRETTDYVSEPLTSETRIVPDGASSLRIQRPVGVRSFWSRWTWGRSASRPHTPATGGRQCASSLNSMTATSQAGGLLRCMPRMGSFAPSRSCLSRIGRNG